MNKNKQLKQKIKLQLSSCLNKHIIFNEISLMKERKFQFRIKKAKEIPDMQIKRSVLVNLIKDQMAISQQQYHKFVNKQSKIRLERSSKQLKKVNSKELIFQSINNKESDALYNNLLLQQAKRAKIIQLCRKDCPSPEKLSKKVELNKNSSEKQRYRKTFNIKSIIPNEQLIQNFKLKHKAQSLPKLPKMIHQKQKYVKELSPLKQRYNKEIEYEFTPWQSKSSRQYFIKIKEYDY